MSSALDLTSYAKIRQALFISIDVPDYGMLRISNHDTAFSITEEDNVSYSYTPQGILLSVSEFNNELQTSKNDITISLAAIDQAFVAGMMSYALKGTPVTIRRVFFNADTGVALSTAGNPSIRFKGVVANYSFNDEFNQFSQTTTTTVSLSCSSIINVLSAKNNSQRTNTSERKYLWPGSILKFTTDGSGTGFQFRVLTTTSTGAIATIGNVVGGTGYANGSFTAVALTTVSGTGSGATANITVSGGIVTVITINAVGSAYRGDDRGFDRVATIANTNFDFGKPYAGT